MVFWPFQALEEMHNDQDEDMEEDGESKRKVPVDSDEMPLAEKQSVAMRLLALVSTRLAKPRSDHADLFCFTSSLKPLLPADSTHIRFSKSPAWSCSDCAPSPSAPSSK